MKPDRLSIATEQLAAYGYALSGNEIMLREKPLGVFVSSAGPRFYACMRDGRKLWSGKDLGSFAARFWYAKKIAS